MVDIQVPSSPKGRCGRASTRKWCQKRRSSPEKGVALIRALERDADDDEDRSSLGDTEVDVR